MNTIEDRLANLDLLIGETEERRIEQMLHIAFLMAGDEDTIEAEDRLQQIEMLLAKMRVQRIMQQSGPNA